MEVKSIRYCWVNKINFIRMILKYKTSNIINNFTATLVNLLYSCHTFSAHALTFIIIVLCCSLLPLSLISITSFSSIPLTLRESFFSSKDVVSSLRSKLPLSPNLWLYMSIRHIKKKARDSRRESERISFELHTYVFILFYLFYDILVE